MIGNIQALRAPVSFVAAAAGEEIGGPKKFEMLAYTGTEILQWSWMHGAYRVVIDLDTLELTAKSRPIFLEHRTWQIVGHSTEIYRDGNNLRARGIVSGRGDAAREVLETAANGFPWQASVGVSVGEFEEVKAGKKVTVNGTEFDGPIYVARNSTLKEISFVVLGADDNTESKIAAARAAGGNMKEDKQDGTTPSPAVAASAADDAVNAVRAATAAELKRVAAIRAACVSHEAIAAQAIEAGWDVTKTELAVKSAELDAIRASRPAAPGVIAHDRVDASPRVIEAALCLTGKMPGTEKQFDAQTLEAAQKAYPHGLSLGELVIDAAAQAGHHVRSIRAASSGAFMQMIRAALSNQALSGILSNVANKALAIGFGAGEMAWAEIARKRAVRDFKTMTVYRLTGDGTLELVPADGQVKSGSLTEESWSLKADTYAKLLNISRQDIINDDLGALTSNPMRLGRGANIALNTKFWSTFISDAAFFTAGRANLLTGGGTALSSTNALAAVTGAETAFAGLTDDQGKPLGLSAQIMLVPRQLHAIARQFYSSAEIRDGTASKVFGTANPVQNLYRPVMSAYLSSATAWYLLADPSLMPTMEVAFLNGVETPTIEEAEPNPDVLGITLRGYFDFGVAQAEWRGGVKSAGA